MIEMILIAIAVVALVLVLRLGWEGIDDWKGSRAWRHEKVDVLNTLGLAYNAMKHADAALVAAGVIPPRETVEEAYIFDVNDPGKFYKINIGEKKTNREVPLFRLRTMNIHTADSVSPTHKAERQ